MVIVLVSSIFVWPEFLTYVTGLYVLDKIFFLMELMVDHVSKSIQFGLMVLVFGASFVVWFMVIPTCSDCDTFQALDVDDGQFPV